VLISGAHLLVHALLGADGLGTPGFRDVSKPADGRWHNDTHRGDTSGKEGLYAIDPATAKEKFPRYPQSGGGYVDDKMRESARSLQDMENKGSVVNLDQADSRIAKNERLFLDPWDHPILYYRASPSGLRMIGEKGKPGVFWQEDNGVLTGTDGGLINHDGLDFGQGRLNNRFHSISLAQQVEPTEQDFVNKIQTEETYKDSFVRFILDTSVKARPTPVNKDSYLLISAGPDARYGTEDDVTNWTKKTD
jgi:hypothetical protein